MAGRILVPGWNRALNSDGDPISASISLFNVGTDELATLYSDEALSVPLANPVESNSAGRFPAIWAADDTELDWSVEAPYGPPGSPFTGTGLTVALAAEVLAAEAAEAAADAAEADAVIAAEALADIIALAESAPDTNPAAIAGKANITGSNITGANTTAFRTAIGAASSAEVAVKLNITGSNIGANGQTFRDAVGAVSGSAISGTPGDKGATANGTANDRTAILAAQTAFGAINLVPLSTGSTYRMDTATAADFTSPIYAPDGVTLSLPSSLDGGAPLYGTMAALEFERPVTVTFRDASFSNRFGPDPDPWLKPVPGLLSNLRRFDATALGGTGVTVRSNDWPGNDAWPTITPSGTTAADVTFTTAVGFNAAFATIAVGETLRQSYKTLPAAVISCGVVIRGTGGFAVLYAPVNDFTNLAYSSYKETGVAAVNNQTLDFPNRGTNSTFAFNNVEWSVTRIASNKVLVKMNGVGVGISGLGIRDVGDIQEVGIAVYANGAGSCTLSGHVVERSDELLGMPRCSNGVVFGDSTAEDMANCWVRYIRPIMDSFAGVQLGPISNQAVVSTDISQAYTAMQVGGALGASNWVVLCSGTNDIQGQTNKASFTATAEAICDYIAAQGKRLIWVIPYLWYQQADAGGTGFAAVNDELGAWYRNEIMRVCASKNVPYVDPTNYLGNPDPDERLEPRGGGQLRDNIHQTSKGHQLYAMAIAKAILSDYCGLPTSGRSNLWSSVLASGTTVASGVPFGFTWDRNTFRLFGLLDVTTITNGTTIMTLPRFMWPDVASRATIEAFDAGAVPLPGAARLDISTAGVVTIQGAPVGTTRIDVRDVVIVRPD